MLLHTTVINRQRAHPGHAAVECRVGTLVVTAVPPSLASRTEMPNGATRHPPGRTEALGRSICFATQAEEQPIRRCPNGHRTNVHHDQARWGAARSCGAAKRPRPSQCGERRGRRRRAPRAETRHERRVRTERGRRARRRARAASTEESAYSQPNVARNPQRRRAAETVATR